MFVFLLSMILGEMIHFDYLIPRRKNMQKLDVGKSVWKCSVLFRSTPHPVTVTNEGLGRDSRATFYCSQFVCVPFGRV